MWHTRKMLVRSSWQRWFLAGMIAGGVFVASPSANADIVGDLGVVGQLQYTDAAGNKVFVAGVDVSIDDVGGATTDGDGNFRIPVPGPGEYSISLDTSTLPAGVALREAERSTTHREGQSER